MSDHGYRLVPMNQSHRSMLWNAQLAGLHPTDHDAANALMALYDGSKTYEDAIAEVAGVISWWLDQAPEFDTAVVAGAILRQLGIEDYPDAI